MYAGATSYGGTVLPLGPQTIAGLTVSGSFSAPNLVNYASIQQLNGLSVMGRSASTTGTLADITGTADQVLRVAPVGASLGFGSIDLSKSAAVSGLLGSVNGGTANGFTKFSGPTTAEKTFTLPDANATLLYSGGALGTPASGVATNLTGTASGLTAGNATNSTIADDTTTNATMYPVWVTANTGNLPLKVTSTKITFNPSTGLLNLTGDVTWDGAAWTPYTSTITSGSGTITTASGAGRWKQYGKMVSFEVTITITTNGTGAGDLRATLPTNAKGTHSVALSGYYLTANKALATYINSALPSVAIVRLYEGSYVFTDGDALLIAGTYEVP